ncbi:hypothetical protein L1D52_06080 [Vibrio brasiliensis]|uniref:hypothetical protein n=1 Tax=Vibrio brasiliensis TaxID=170652 RepID=UPI001EFE4D7D|nr:hypothetical protein [Vibrio brasiliensis]MCG9781918.1 hypothetical protein [Vibrio brasiliensis]
MTELEQQLSAIEADSIPAITLPGDAWEQFCQRHAPLFAKAVKRNPDKPATHGLLGILTKAHMEETASLESQIAPIQAMQDVLVSNLGEQHAAKFEQQGAAQLVLVTHLWLYLQGYLKMDFSLANDHADNTAQLIASLNKQDPQWLRTQFLESFYHGVERSGGNNQGSSGLFGWIKRMFSS